MRRYHAPDESLSVGRNKILILRTHFNIPESQCMTFKTNCRLSVPG
jgi:hypothetical protein